ncbi:hypothetical protein JB92DRAFT_2830687 [Gautieria morchelliformis]|nr:hypothetical protein JB92DRAFT_2830687 [Gautieria morchelliformis]
MSGSYEKASSKLQELSFMDHIGSHCDNILVGVLYEPLVGELVHSDKEWWYFEGGTWKNDGGEYLYNIISERLMKALSYKLGDPKFVGKLNSNDLRGDYIHKVVLSYNQKI